MTSLHQLHQEPELDAALRYLTALPLSPVIGLDTRRRMLPCLDGDGAGRCVMPPDGVASCVNSEEMLSILTGERQTETTSFHYERT